MRALPRANGHSHELSLNCASLSYAMTLFLSNWPNLVIFLKVIVRNYKPRILVQNVCSVWLLLVERKSNEKLFENEELDKNIGKSPSILRLNLINQLSLRRFGRRNKQIPHSLCIAYSTHRFILQFKRILSRKSYPHRYNIVYSLLACRLNSNILCISKI